MKDFVSAGNILQNLILNIKNSQFAREIKIAFFWENVVGELLSSKTYLKKLTNNVLFVGVYNSVWLQEMLLQKHDIIKKLNKYLMRNERIKDIYFYISERKYSA